MCRYKFHSNALRCAKTYKIQAVTVNELLKDKEIEIVLNLTIPKAHYKVAKQALVNGKHVYSEKPLAINFKDGKDLLKNCKKEKTLYWERARYFFGWWYSKIKRIS